MTKPAKIKQATVRYSAHKDTKEFVGMTGTVAGRASSGALIVSFEGSRYASFHPSDLDVIELDPQP